jgi:hypothetical protein
MIFPDTIKNSLRILFVLCLGLQASGHAEDDFTALTAPFPSPETLSYRIEWRMITAGEAKLQLSREQQNLQIQLNLESAGLVSRLFRVDDNYKVVSNEKFCGESSSFEAKEGKRHVVEAEQFDNARHKATFDQHDLVKNVQEHHELDIAPCTHEIIGALASLRLTKLDPGKSITVPIVNGKKMAYAKIEAQARESIIVDGKTYQTTRYEAFIFDNVVFRRKGSLLVWLSDDAAHVPVQLRFQMGFPIGTITLELQKAEST